MTMFTSPSGMTEDEIETIEKQTLRWIHRAVMDFGFEAYDIFYLSPDEVKDVAEDITREMLERLPGFNISQRIFGNVDYKKARYIILPEQTVRQALFVDSKAEKESRTATIQMSQTSMWIRQVRSGQTVNEKGLLPEISEYHDVEYLTTTDLVHFHYHDRDGKHLLQKVTLAAIPNGKLQARYNPDETDTIWLAGRNAPTRGEDFRVRLSFGNLEAKAKWRVQTVEYDASNHICTSIWEE
jgi:hypothetical protein